MTITNGYATLAEFKSYAAIDSANAPDDAVIEDLIEAASRYIDNATNRRFYAATETRYFDTPAGTELHLDSDLASVSTLTNGDTSVIGSGEYNLLPLNLPLKRSIKLKASSTILWRSDSSNNTEGVISVAGSWGMATVPDDIKQACLDIAKVFYKQRFGEGESTTASVTAGAVIIAPTGIPSKAAAIIRNWKQRL